MENTMSIRKNPSDLETGLVIKNNYKAPSGFNYVTGVREVGKLKVVEGVAKGAACIILKSVMVFDQHGKLIFDAEVKNMTVLQRVCQTGCPLWHVENATGSKFPGRKNL
ncbi:MAG: hypothetical protein IPH20_13635 [Bacteroidales bacterium]|nr:hypothetical protein [Bacteroidales bacterium]